MSSSVHTANEHTPFIYTRIEAAARLRISPRKLDQLIASHELPVIRIGAAVRICQTDLEEYVASCRNA